MSLDLLTAAGSIAAIVAALAATSSIWRKLWRWVRNPSSSPPWRAVAWLKAKRGVAVGREALVNHYWRHVWSAVSGKDWAALMWDGQTPYVSGGMVRDYREGGWISFSMVFALEFPPDGANWREVRKVALYGPERDRHTVIAVGHEATGYVSEYLMTFPDGEVISTPPYVVPCCRQASNRLGRLLLDFADTDLEKVEVVGARRPVGNMMRRPALKGQ